MEDGPHNRSQPQSAELPCQDSKKSLFQNIMATTALWLFFLLTFQPSFPFTKAQFDSLRTLSPPLKQTEASKREKHRNCQMQFLSRDDKFAAIYISKQKLQLLSSSQAVSQPPIISSSAQLPHSPHPCRGGRRKRGWGGREPWVKCFFFTVQKRKMAFVWIFFSLSRSPDNKHLKAYPL